MTLQCSKCYATLEDLKEKKLADFLIPITKGEGKEAHICPICLSGW